ncbi:glycoside hydrolase [Allorhizobium sp. BGMRC 0089]|uniref:glycoside hydrolase family protein n=1 Tax=Allorhizobium sonneratiae TaxID=2934936 RepID=UPI002034955D|nr:glycoside hydrolase [Allorhizobium sonneratiae]MCM2293022.1 glycoside hydrolase [Allorhizobium sonneratiae]
MPTIKLKPSKRAKAVLAAFVVASGSAGVYISQTGDTDTKNLPVMVEVFPGQPPVPDDVALAINKLVKPWEGRSLKAYLDRLPTRPRWTVCDGDTENVTPGMVETPQGCDRRVAVKMVRDYRPVLAQKIKGWEHMPLSWRAMMDSLAWNIGADAAVKSTAARLGEAALAKGDDKLFFKSCEAATAYNRSGGRFIVGLGKRRGMGDATRIGEGELCVSGLDEGAAK